MVFLRRLTCSTLAACAAMTVGAGVASADETPPPAPVIDVSSFFVATGPIEWSDPNDFADKVKSEADRVIGDVRDRVNEGLRDILAALPIAKGSFQLTSEFAPRWGTHHDGIDMAAPLGTPIVSAVAGKVIEAGPASGFGNWIRVEDDNGDIQVYGHMASSGVLVAAGQRVEAGEKIALVGNEGYSTGPHLHFEVWKSGVKIDPIPWLNDRNVSVTG